MLLRYFYYISIVAGVVFASFFLFTQPVAVKGISMQPTFNYDDKLLVEKVSWRFSIARGDLLVFTNPHDTNEVVVKRVIGLPNESVEVTEDGVRITSADGTSKLFTHGTVIGGAQSGEFFSMQLGSEDYFVLGDNRSQSEDSRTWGAVQKVNIIGKPVVNLTTGEWLGVRATNDTI